MRPPRLKKLGPRPERFNKQPTISGLKRGALQRLAIRILAVLNDQSLAAPAKAQRVAQLRTKLKDRDGSSADLDAVITKLQNRRGHN